MRPVPRCDSKAADPVDVETAARAVEHELPELSFEVGLHPKELEPQHLCLESDRMGSIEAGIDCISKVYLCARGAAP